MQNIVIEEPYEFVPPVYSNFWPFLIKHYVKRYIPQKPTTSTPSSAVRSNTLQASLEAGHSVLIAPNHCRMSDPLTLNPIVQQTGRYMHAMASWHLFKQGRL